MNIEAFKAQVLPVKDKLYRFALKMIQDESTAEDIVQEVFIKVWNNRDRFDEIKNIEAWCMRATRNLAIDKMRSKHRRVQELDHNVMRVDKTPDPHRQTVTNEIMDLVRKFIGKLPERQRMIMHLREIECMSYNEIAQALDLTISQVKVGLFRARQKVKAQLIKADIHGI